MDCFRFPSGLTEAELKGNVEETDRAFDAQLGNLANELAGRKELRLLGLTGPSCSGKTTAAKKLIECFSECGRTVHVISIDDFFYEKERLWALSRARGETQPDYDSEETIDTDLLRICTESLLSNHPTRLPRFNFNSGLREVGEEIIPTDADVFLFEGIQVLYPMVDALLQRAAYRSVFICPESSIRVGGCLFQPNEIRLMRRLVRDFRHRSAEPSFTLALWRSVRQNEERNIFPNAHICRDFVDSVMPYEIGMLKPFLETILPRVGEEDPNRNTAVQILEKLRGVQPISADYIREKSIYKEFI